MYEQHFGFSDKPFRVVPSPRFLYVSETHDESRARILYGVRESRGFVVVTGAVGLGKTTVLLSVLEELDDRVRTALVFNPVETFSQLLRLICLEFGIETEQKDEVALLWELNLFLVDALSQHLTCVLLIDEAQNLSIEMLEKVRTLSNLQTETASLLQVVLVGQPELRVKLDDPRLVQLRQRVGVWHEITALEHEDTQAYIWHRLRLAGHTAPERLFPAVACARIHGWAQGVPRLINQICDTALVIAFGAQENTIQLARVDEAAAELRLTESARAGRGSGAVTSPTSESTRRTSNGPRLRDAHDDAARPRHLWRWAIATLLVLVLGWLGGQVAGLWGGPAAHWGPSPGGAAPNGDAYAGGQDPVSAVASSLEEPESESPVEGAEVVHDEAARVRMAERVGEVERALQRGEVLYCAHLASFRTEEQTVEFARELLGVQPEWSEPLFVERSESGWLRVMAGGFPEREMARQWVGVLKQDRGVTYAQLERLGPAAQPLRMQ